ncbi:MAG: hypothetical protein Q8867_00550 [Bacteroidota bacterium]|nr:hypothetical protein [Bacteroidota bacterium]
MSKETLNAAANGGTVISSQMQSFLMNSIIVAADSGHNFFFPNNEGGLLLGPKSALDNPNWSGPDATGWYYRYYTSGGYTYYEKLYLGDTVQYIMDMSYSGGDGSFENKITTTYIKKTKNNKTLYDGSSIWEIHNSGYNDISKWEWRIYFTDWNPSTGAGTYDWYWALYENSGGNTVPYHRFEHMSVTETTPEGWLHCLVIFYDDSGTEVWKFDYDTPWITVEMPQIPG